MSFATAALTTSIVAFVLGLGWLLAGRLLMKRWGVEAQSDGLLVGRRLGAVYVSIAVMLMLGRSAPPSDLRSAVAVAMLVALTLLAVLGLFEYWARRAGIGILISVAIEAVLAFMFGWALLTS